MKYPLCVIVAAFAFVLTLLFHLNINKARETCKNCYDAGMDIFDA